MDIALLSLACLGLLMTLTDWRKGLLVCVAAGFLQDPLRKLTAGEPLYLTGLVGVFFAVTVFSARIQNRLVRLKKIPLWRILRAAVIIFVLLVALQSFRTLTRYDSPMLAMLGLLAYLTPLPSALLGYSFASSARRVITFLVYYVVFSSANAVGVYLGFLGYRWEVLEQVGPGLIVWSKTAQNSLDIYPGFLRAPEIAVWHTVTAACLLVILGLLAKRPAVKVVVATLILFLLGAGLLTGRRKVLVIFVLFLSIYWFLLVYFRRGAPKLAALAVLIGIVGTIVTLEILDPQPGGGAGSLAHYLEHGVTGFLAAPGRFGTLGLHSMMWALRDFGLFGGGAGIGTTGAQHFGGGSLPAGPAAEGGIGRIVAELGIPGLLVLLWLTALVSRHVWRSMKGLSFAEPRLARLVFGLVALLGANAMNYVVASQVYGDLFVLLMIGWVLGFTIAMLGPAGKERPAGQVVWGTTRLQGTVPVGRPV